eukprot:2715608-Prymnesium_polylepis.2
MELMSSTWLLYGKGHLVVPGGIRVKEQPGVAEDVQQGRDGRIVFGEEGADVPREHVKREARVVRDLRRQQSRLTREGCVRRCIQGVCGIVLRSGVVGLQRTTDHS